MPEEVYDTGPATNAEFETDDAPVHLHVAGDAGHRVRRGPRHRRAHPAQDHRGAGRPRPGRLRDRTAVGDRARRRPGAHLLRAPGRHRPRRRARRASSTATAPTRRASTRPSPRCGCRCSTAGFVFAIAHVRGGGELGRPWYDDGKLLHKRNTFTDFIACAEHLVAEGLTAPRPARGARRVGGRAPDGRGHQPAPRPVRGRRGRGALRRLPHDDPRRDPPPHRHRVGGVGQPRGRPGGVRVHEGLQPLRQRGRRVAYPTILATAGLNDPRVSYWEPAKWVQQPAGPAPRAAARSSSRRRWAPATRGRRVATTRGGTRPSCSRSCSTPWAGSSGS